MAVTTTDAQTVLNGYVTDLNEAAKTRNFPAVIGKWFPPDGRLNFHNETQGRDGAKRVWEHMLPTGQAVPHEVVQVPYKVENGRVYSWRSLSGGSIPKPIYNVQETQFDDRTLISELHIMSSQEKPEVDTDPEAARDRLGRIFVAFGEAFNDFFTTGQPGLLDAWVADDIRMIVDNNLTGFGIIQHYARITPESKIELGDVEVADDGQVLTETILTDRSGTRSSWKTTFRLTDDGKIQEVNLSPGQATL